MCEPSFMCDPDAHTYIIQKATRVILFLQIFFGFIAMNTQSYNQVNLKDRAILFDLLRNASCEPKGYNCSHKCEF